MCIKKPHRWGISFHRDSHIISSGMLLTLPLSTITIAGCGVAPPHLIVPDASVGFQRYKKAPN
jgi:hypothetical protein